jgi:hypothetical protein
MKTIIRLLESNPLHLIFITIVLIMPIFLAGSATAQSQCAAFGFCDRDGDGFFKSHKRCGACGGVTDCDDSTHDPDNCSGSGEGGDDAPNPYNLARASFATEEQLQDPIPDPAPDPLPDPVMAGIFADNQDTCTIKRKGIDVTYDYWAWQERLLSPDINLIVNGVDKFDNKSCESFDNRSDVSGGGRWFLITTAGPEQLSQVVRWVVVDFSVEVDSDGNPVSSPECPDLDSAGNSNLGISGSIYAESLGQHPSPNDSACVDHLTVRLPAERILKANASVQQLEITIRHQPEGSIYWPPWGSINYVDPLYLRSPDQFGPFGGRDCTVMSTRPAWDAPHDKAIAELTRSTGPGKEDVVALYSLPMEVCVIRASD